MKQSQYYADSDEAAALIRAYGYLVKTDCRWLAGLPGIDAKRLRATYQAQQRGDVWALDDILEACRKPVLTFPTGPAPAAQQEAA
jgi:hypothetical protein